MRVKEEQEKNTMLKQLHKSLLKAKELQDQGEHAEAAKEQANIANEIVGLQERIQSAQDEITRQRNTINEQRAKITEIQRMTA